MLDHTRVCATTPDGLRLVDCGDVAAGLIVWCGGFRASGLAARSGLHTDELGRLVVDRALRSLSHPQILAAGDCVATPPSVAGSGLRLCCQAAMPAAAHAADVVLAQLKGREPRELHFGYIHQPISLGRRDRLIQFVDCADRPKRSILTGRRAAIYKQLITAEPIPSIRIERLIPGSSRWPFKEPKAQRLEPGATVHG